MFLRDGTIIFLHSEEKMKKKKVIGILHERPIDNEINKFRSFQQGSSKGPHHKFKNLEMNLFIFSHVAGAKWF